MSNTHAFSNAPYFDRNTTAIIKGIALLMMFVHHFFTFPGWWLSGISYPTIERFAPSLNEPLKLCVAVFCFITGYFYFFNHKKTFKYSFKKIDNILVNYWFCFAILAVFAALFAHYSYSAKDILLECFLLSDTTMLFCWYVSFYCITMLLLPIIVKYIISRNIYWDIFFALFVIPISFDVLYNLSQFVLSVNHPLVKLLNNMDWLPAILLGYIFAQYGVFSFFDRFGVLRHRVLGILFCLIIVFVIPFGRLVLPYIAIPIPFIHKSFTIRLDFLYASFFIYATVNLCKLVHIQWTSKLLAQIGNYSLLMWFLSCIFFNTSKEVTQPILYWPKNPILVTIWGTFLCYIAAFVLDIAIKKYISLRNSLFKNLRKRH